MVKAANMAVLRTCIVHWTSLVPVYLASTSMVIIVKQVILCLIYKIQSIYKSLSFHGGDNGALKVVPQ